MPQPEGISLLDYTEGFGQDPSLTPGCYFRYFPLPFRLQPSLRLTSHVPQFHMTLSILSSPLLRAHLWLPPTQRKAKVLTIWPHFPPSPPLTELWPSGLFPILGIHQAHSHPRAFALAGPSARDISPRYLSLWLPLLLQFFT